MILAAPVSGKQVEAHYKQNPVSHTAHFFFIWMLSDEQQGIWEKNFSPYTISVVFFIHQQKSINPLTTDVAFSQH